jgi:ABC-type xylose transport system permease subunit
MIYVNALGPALPFTGLKRSVIGNCTILAPPKQMQLIMQGVEYLRTLDPEMFQKLTAEREYVFWYHKQRYMRCKEYFSIPDNFLLWGKEGIVTCFVQSIMSSSLEESPFKKSLVTRRQVLQQVFEWVRKHSLPPELVKQYQEFAENA